MSETWIYRCEGCGLEWTPTRADGRQNGQRCPRCGGVLVRDRAVSAEEAAAGVMTPDDWAEVERVMARAADWIKSGRGTEATRRELVRRVADMLATLLANPAYDDVWDDGRDAVAGMVRRARKLLDEEYEHGD